MTLADVKRELRPGARVRCLPGTEVEHYALRHGLSTRGTVIDPGVVAGDRVRVEWDNNHPGDRRPKHRETIAVEHVEPL